MKLLDVIIRQIVLVGAILCPFQGQAIPVYKTPHQVKPLKNVSLDVLARQQRNKKSKSWEKVSVRGRPGWVRSSLLLSPYHLADTVKLSKGVKIFQRPHREATFRALNKTQKVSVLRVEETWLYFQSQDSNPTKGWVRFSEAQLPQKDPGYIFSFEDRKVRAQPSNKSNLKGQLPRLHKVKVVDYLPGWAKVRWKAGSGYVQLKNVMTLWSFSTQVQGNQQPLQKIKQTQDGTFFLMDGSSVPYADIERVELEKNLRYVMVSTAHIRSKTNTRSDLLAEMKQLSPLQVTDLHEVLWVQSSGPAGQRWWWTKSPESKPETGSGSAPASPASPASPAKTRYQNSRVIPTNQLFQRPIFDIATSPVVPQLMFASAQGIYKSYDGQSWQLIDKFKDKNYPIAIGRDGTVIVGPFKSHNHGKSFESYIRWDQLLQVITKEKSTYPSHLSMKEIHILDRKANQLTLVIDYNQRSFRVHTTDQGKTWRLQKQPQ